MIDLAYMYQLAFVLTKQGRGKAARAMIDALNHSNAVWTFEDRMLALGLARIGTFLARLSAVRPN